MDRIFELITNCRYSIHDLSRVELDRVHPATPRFNMPFELGLAVGWSKMKGANSHVWFMFESVDRRIQKSLSDLNGTDVYVHDGTVDGVFRELNNAFVRVRQRPTIDQMRSVFAALKRDLGRIKTAAGGQSLFTARVFKDLVVLARTYAQMSTQRT